MNTHLPEGIYQSQSSSPIFVKYTKYNKLSFIFAMTYMALCIKFKNICTFIDILSKTAYHRQNDKAQLCTILKDFRSLKSQIKGKPIFIFIWRSNIYKTLSIKCGNFTLKYLQLYKKFN